MLETVDAQVLLGGDWWVPRKACGVGEERITYQSRVHPAHDKHTLTIADASASPMRMQNPMEGAYSSRSPMKVPTKKSRLEAGRKGATMSPTTTKSRHRRRPISGEGGGGPGRGRGGKDSDIVCCAYRVCTVRLKR